MKGARPDLASGGTNGAGRWRLVSDHPAWAPVPWPSGAEIVGEVRWAARTFA